MLYEVITKASPNRKPNTISLMKLLEARDIAHHFDYPLFSDVGLTLNSHESVAIIGVSGSGKSTLLHILSTLLQPDRNNFV